MQERAIGRVRNTIARFRALQQDFVAFCPEFFSAPDWTLLVGYWQSEAYFARHAEQIRDELTIRSPPGPRLACLLEEVRVGTSVSVHVRRGDYVTNPEVNRRIGALDERYYHHAIGAVAERTGATDLRLVVFSDDRHWAQRNLDHRRFRTTFVEGRPEDAADDLRLMSACRHHVIANSSLSWWGAWLDPRADKVVVAPRQWFRDSRLDSSWITPASWLRL